MKAIYPDGEGTGPLERSTKRKTGRYKKRKGETEQGKEKREDERTLRGEDRVD